MFENRRGGGGVVCVMKFFFVAAGLYVLSAMNFNRIKTFLQEQVSMQATYMYI